MEKPSVRGVRICRHCRGICHEASWREQYGQRKKYWCSESCLRTDHYADDVPMAVWEAFRHSTFEQVDVIAK